MPKKPRVKRQPIKRHACVPLYRQIPKELQTGWIKYGPHDIEAWDNTTDVLPFISKMARPDLFDYKLYCGICGRHMVKRRDGTQNPLENAKPMPLPEPLIPLSRVAVLGNP